MFTCTTITLIIVSLLTKTINGADEESNAINKIVMRNPLPRKPIKSIGK